MEFILPAHEVNVKSFFKLAQADACANIQSNCLPLTGRALCRLGN